MPKPLLHLIAAAVVLAGPAAAAAADLTGGARRVADQALADRTAWTVLESLTTDIGPRPVGTPAMTRARDWGVATLKGLGFENVHVETFTTPVWVRGAERAEVVSPAPQGLRVLALGGSAPTPPGGLVAEIVLFRAYQDLLDQPAGALAGKIAVVTQPMRRTQSGEGYSALIFQRVAGPVEAARRGAVGYLVRSLSTAEDRQPHTGGARAGGIPAAALSPIDAEQLERLVARGKPVVVRLELASTTIPQAPAFNIVGEIRGAERPDEVVVVGGHLDSWDPGTGAIDDGAGVAITTAAARLAAAQGRPRRTIRVVMFGSEEQTGSGPAYAEAHKAEVGRIVVAGESDFGADEIVSVRLPQGSADHPAMTAFRRVLPGLRTVVSDVPAKSGGADISRLIAAGAPFVDFDQDGTRYFDIHHSAEDTLDKVDPARLAQNVAVWASFLYTVANSDIDFRQPFQETSKP